MEATLRRREASGRVPFLDNLRTFTIFAVVMYHAGLVYESSGLAGLFWIVDDPATNDATGILHLIFDTFLMPMMFFLAGHFSLVSLRRKGGWGFIKARFRRLMLPWLLAVFTLIPIYKYLFLRSRGLPQAPWTDYFYFVDTTAQGWLYGQNWLWFLPVLFLFSLLFVLLARIRLDLSKLTVGKALGGAFFVCLGNAFLFDLMGWTGWTKTPVLDFQNERLLVYFLSFLLGALCQRRGTLLRPPGSKKLFIFVAATSWIPTSAYVFFVIVAFFYPGRHILSEVVDALILRVSFLLTLLSMVTLLVVTFRRYFHMRGRIARALSRSTYGVYLIHVVVLGGLAMALLGLPLPSLLKHFLLAFSTFLVSSFLVWSYKKVAAGTEEASRRAGGGIY